MINRQTTTLALLCLGLAGALASSGLLAATTALLAVLGGYLIKTKALADQGWDTPKELRLIHFAFWFFVLTSAISWAIEGFSYEGGKTLGTHARFLLFWPLVIALTASDLRARHVFTIFGVCCAVIVALFACYLLTSPLAPDTFLLQRFGAGINPIQFGNLALLCALLGIASALFFLSEKRYLPATILILLAASALAVALLSQTRSNLLALPVLLLLAVMLAPKPARLPAFAILIMLGVVAIATSDRFTNTVDGLLLGKSDNSIELRLEAWDTAYGLFREQPVLGAGLAGYHRAALTNTSPAFRECCADHAHSDAIHAAANKGLLGVLSWALLIIIPFAALIRQGSKRNSPAIRSLGIAGAMIPAGYLIFGLTETTFDRSLFLTFYLVSIAAVAAALFNELSASYTRHRRVKVSATIITKNEEDHIADCLQSARQVADEIIVLDSGSTDRTVEIARQYADIVEVTDWPGFGVQKQRALEKATGDWVLSIDADERITPQLAREINHTLAEPDADAYKLPWAVTLYGTRLDFGRSGRAPLRLFRRAGVRFSDALVHEKILIPDGRTTRTLRGRLTHYTHRNFGHALEKSATYAWLGSREKFRRGKKTRTLLYPAFRGLLTFVQVYVIRGGFLDGSVGFLVAVTYAQGSFNKYAGLWTLTRTQHTHSN
ncbi:MAG TPA: glycosyltransferase [Marinobacter sp.]|nr:glycosyltransferase [Marinobacter sp.]